MALSHHIPRELRILAFALGSPLRITLATKIHSLARYSKRTLQHLNAVTYDNCEISSSFDSLSRVLFNITSRYWYAIGLKTYLVLEVNASLFPASYPRDSTQDTALIFSISPTGLSPYIVLHSSRVWIIELYGCEQSYNTTFPLHFCKGFSLDYAVFSRPY
jgi:hypothetical protein